MIRHRLPLLAVAVGGWQFTFRIPREAFAAPTAKQAITWRAAAATVAAVAGMLR